MAAQPPAGEPAPIDGSLPTSALEASCAHPWGLYVHVPFCVARCGYCDFNTYTPAELSDSGLTNSGLGDSGPTDLPQHIAAYAEAVVAELDLATKVIGEYRQPVTSVFFGGGTPNLLPAAALVEMLAEVRRRFEWSAEVEVTLEANPESVQPGQLETLRAGGFNRISFGMQSAMPHVLAVLDRRHTPERVPQVVRQARSAGFDQVSLDLIYGTPGETMADWQHTLQSALTCAPDHVSAYSLIVEPGTALARQVATGKVELPEDDLMADFYLAADDLFKFQGLRWYEISNWATRKTAACQHNLNYWLSGNWWGFGPGAHSHVGGVRWWNRKHPRAYADSLQADTSPAQGREVLDATQQHLEAVMLELRLAKGLAMARLTATERERVPGLVSAGLVKSFPDRVVLTQRGRLLADRVTRDLLD